MIEVLGRLSSINVRKVVWTCAELGLDYRREDWGAGYRATDAPDYLDLNPNGLIPVMRDADLVLWESNTIIRYLANRYGGYLYPAEPIARARVDQWIDWQATDLNMSWSYAFLALARRLPDYNDAARIQASETAWNRNMAILDAQLARSGAFVAGETFSLADIPIGLSVHRWRMTPLDHPPLAHVAAYYDRMRHRAAFAALATGDMP